MKLKFIVMTSGLFFKIILLSMISVLFGDCNSQELQNDEYFAKRKMMVDSQIISRGIQNRLIIDAMLKVERHLFVPPEHISQAYGDYPLPIGEGQTISQPYIVALMTENLNLKKTSRVLEIGTGSGYQTAILAEICDSVFSVEIYESLAEKAENLLNVLGYNNIKVKTGDGYQGWFEYSPFDAIMVTCAPTHVPQDLQDQLAEGGRMVIPVGELHDQELVLFEKTEGKFRKKDIVAVRFVPMIDHSGRKY
jgi:protein-L-isoaspartate(D-aspartate) O-methyltransferase